MNKVLMTILALGIMSCSKSDDKILKETNANLSSEKVLSYCVKELRVKGKRVGDTIRSTTTSVFHKLDTDSLCGFKYLLEKKLIFKSFKTPITLLSFYNGNCHTWDLHSEMQKSRRITEKPEKLIKKIKNDTYGQIPYVINIINSCGFTLDRKKEILLNKVPCILLKTVSESGISNNLYINKKTSLPILLRVIENSKQALTRQFNYSKFEFSDTFNEPSFSNSKKKEVKSV
jgi:hypothetical protein